MCNVREENKLPLADKIVKFINEFPDLRYNGAKILCEVCEVPLMRLNRRDCKRHVTSLQHKNKKNGVLPQTQCKLDLLFMFIVCGIPLSLLDKEPFREFWRTYNLMWNLPSRTTLRSDLPNIRRDIEDRIKAELKHKRLWLCLDQTTDCKKNSILNIIVRVLDPVKPKFAILLASRRLKKCTGEAITSVVFDTLQQFQVSTNQLLMFMSNDTATMCSVGRSLKEKCEALLHVTCKVDALYFVIQTIRECYPEVDAFIANTKEVFLKYPKRIRRLCPGIREPPKPSFTRWRTWLQEALYYSEYFEEVESVILQFGSDEAPSIKESQKRFLDTSVETDLKIISRNYKGLLDAIENLHNTGLLLVESVQILDEVNTLLHGINDAKNSRVVAKFDSAMKKNSDYTRLRRMCDGTSIDSLTNFKDYFNYACVTSVDVERSLSKYKHIFSSRRSYFTETNAETYLMVHTFHQSYPLC